MILSCILLHIYIYIYITVMRMYTATNSTQKKKAIINWTRRRPAIILFGTMKFHLQRHLIRKQYFMYYQLSDANILYIVYCCICVYCCSCLVWVLLSYVYLLYCVCVAVFLLQMSDCCWLEVSTRKVLRSATSTQVFLGFPVSISKCWDGSQDPKLPLHASHVALPT